MSILEHYRSFHLPDKLTRVRCTPPMMLLMWHCSLGSLPSDLRRAALIRVLRRQLAGWAQRASQRQSVLDSEVAPPGTQDYSAALLQHYSRYADATANSTSARDFK